MASDASVSVSDLGALFAPRAPPRDPPAAPAPPPPAPQPPRGSDPPAAPRSTTPGYGRRGGARSWRPTAQLDFRDGGAFPEIDVVQLPLGLGWGAAAGRRPRRGRVPDADRDADRDAAPGDAAAPDDDDDAPRLAPPAALECGFAELETRAARLMLRLVPSDPPDPRRGTPEYDAFVDFVARLRGDAASENVLRAVLRDHPNARPARRVRNVDPETVAAEFLGATEDTAGNHDDPIENPSSPVVVEDGGRGWGLAAPFRDPGADSSSSSSSSSSTIHSDASFRPVPFSALLALGSARALCNDRAPARHADARDREAGKQRTVSTSVSDFARYVAARPGIDDGVDALRAADAPFYMNGWRAFDANEPAGGEGSRPGPSSSPRSVADVANEAFPPPYFATRADHSREIMLAAHRALFPRVPDVVAETFAGNFSRTLSKMFVGPAGTVTRLHQDAGDAHAWLGQAAGRKLFVLCPPADAAHLRVLPGERETAQAEDDPLDRRRESVEKSAGYWRDATPVVCVLEPGEVALVPRGWWHYAVALEPSWTVMRNFYEARTNAEALVKTVAKGAGLVGGAKKSQE